MRNNTNYMETGVLSGLELTSQFPEVVLENYYKKSRNSIEAGKTETPHGYVFPSDQADMTRVAWVINILRLQGIEVGRASNEVKLKEGTYPAGSLIIKRDQPYGRLAKILLEKQNYPDPQLRTYDDSAWTMGLMAHVKVVEIADPDVLGVPVETIKKFEPRGTVANAGSAGLAVLDNGSPNMVTLRYRLKGVAMKIAEEPFESGGRKIPAGSFVIAAIGADAAAKLKAVAEPLGLTAVALSGAPDVKMHDADLPKLAVFSTWGNTQEVGWVRHAFDQFEVPFDLIFKERIKQGNLRAAYDVIVIPHQRGGKGLVFDIEPRHDDQGKSKPLAYTKTEQFKFLGDYGSSEDITGGMGLEGVLEFQKFVEQGGLLVTLGQASTFPADFGIARRVNASSPSQQFYAPGPIIDAEILRPTHPIFYGYTDKTITVRWASGLLLNVPEQDRGQTLMRFTGGDSSVRSGLMRGANEIRNRAAILDVPVGRGRVLIFATNPCYRWQNLGEFRMLFNAVMNYNDMPATPAAGPGRGSVESGSAN